MSNQQIALRLALEALEGSISVSMANIALRHKAITVIKEALAQPEHPEQMARLGWQYVECPACGAEGARAFPKPYCQLQDDGSKYFGESWDKAEQREVKDVVIDNLGDPFIVKAYVTPQPAQQEPEFFTHNVEQPYDWSEWVCPDPKSYLMKCCDCGLVHEAEFGVVRYKSETEREDCEPVDDPNLQAVFRMRRSEQWSPADTAHRAGGLPMEQPAPMSESNRVIAYAASSKLHDLGYQWLDGGWVQPAPRIVDCHATGVCVQSGLRAEQPAPAITPEHLLALAQTASLGLDKVIEAFKMAAPVQQEPIWFWTHPAYGKLYKQPPPAQPERVRELECVIADLKAECQAIRAKQPTAEESSVVQPAPVPEGWKLVPVEPTDEMLDAAQFVVTDIYRVDVDRVYAAMLRNAPEKGQP